MIELSRHIENLLLDHDCVIVPDLGGFVAHYVSASWKEDEQLFLPPYRNVGFNPSLLLNDGLLVHSYMQVYDASYVDASRMIEDAVREVKTELQESGECDLRGIGHFVYKTDGNIEFQPYEAGLPAPSLYGLYSYSLNFGSQNNIVKLETNKKSEEIETVARDNKEYAFTFKVNRELVNYISAAVVAVMFYFLWAVPTVIDSNTPSENLAVFGSVTRVENKESKAPDADRSTSTEQLEKIIKEESAPCYTIVLASAITKQRASDYVNQLRDEGYEDATVHITKTMVRVVYGFYSDEGQAYRALRECNGASPFDQAWVMKLR
ncbi:MAG: SPOR domain-containing protein [Bacteroidaceae bacterium]|nr:SPOR domain-containing protein [Bacteroidaceae bacterium]